MHNVAATMRGIELTWWRFALQFVTVLVGFAIASVIPILFLGQTSVGLALSAATSMSAALLIAWFWLRSDDAVAEAFDISRPSSWRHTIVLALLMTVAILLIFLAGPSLLELLGSEAPDTVDVIAMVREGPMMLLLWITLVAWGSAAFGEELLWRGFLIDRLSRLRGLSGRPTLIVLIQASLFAFPHIYQGWGGVIVTGAVGFLLGWGRMYNRGNLWALIIAHGLVDTVMLTLGYLDAFAFLASD